MAMTWIRLDCSLTRHPKVSRFGKSMGVGRHEAIGILVDLWTWAVDYCDGDGDLSKYTSDEILTALGVGQQAALIQVDMIEALLTAGLLDRQGERLTLHDWDEHQGQLVSQREANRERQRRYRQKKRGVPLADHPDIPTVDATVTPSDATVTVTSPSPHGATYERTNVDDVRTQRPANRHDDDVVLEHEALTPITEGDCKKWRELFPSVDLDVELEKMRIYLESAPKSKAPKASLPRFAMNWLQRASKDAAKDQPIADREQRRLDQRNKETQAQIEALAESKGASSAAIREARKDMAQVFQKSKWKKAASE
jgi:hypothetical protein